MTGSASGSIGPARLLTLLLFSAGLGIFLCRLRLFPFSEAIAHFFTLESLPPSHLAKMDEVLLVPLAAVVVVFVRHTLGIRMLGPFRPILIAIGMKGTGILLGLVFFVTVLAVILVIRPRLKEGGLPYFGRLSALLCLVVLFQVLVLLVGVHLEVELLTRTIFFPIVVLTLAADGFARALADEGRSSAMWRGATTVAVAVVILIVNQLPGVRSMLVRFPELILIGIGLVLLIAAVLDFRFLEKLNPKPCVAMKGPDVTAQRGQPPRVTRSSP